MSVVACPYCNAENEVADGFASLEVTCASCGEAFVASTDAPPPPGNKGSRPMPRPKRAPHPTIVGAGPRNDAGDAIDDSWSIVKKWAAILIIAALVFFVLFKFTGAEACLWLGIVAASALHIWFMLWVMAYVRAIAKHTSR